MAVLGLGGSDCEAVRDGWLGQPVNSVSSLAYVVAGVAIARNGGPPGPVVALVAAGVGSALYHGPMPAVAGSVHDASLVLLLVALVHVVWRRRVDRPRALAVIAAGAGITVNLLSRTGAPLCRPGSLVQGHAAWHVLTAFACAAWLGRARPARRCRGRVDPSPVGVLPGAARCSAGRACPAGRSELPPGGSGSPARMTSMSAELPVGFEWRRPGRDDAEAVFAVIDRHNTPVVGSPDITLAEVRDELCEPGFDPDLDAWLVRDDAGADVAYGWAFRKSSSDLVDIDVYADEEVAGWLWAQVLARARALGADAGHHAITVDIGIYQNDGAQQRWARAHGFAPATTFQRMRVDFAGPPAEPVVPARVVVRTGPGDEAFRRHAHHVSSRAFVEHFGHAERSFEEWHTSIDAATTSDWDQVRVAYIDERPVAMVRGSDQFVDDENCGYVATVAVLPDARGQGLAKLLLLQAFVDDFRRGRGGTVLHVDANNVTPAVDLYRHVGMRAVLAIDVWQARLPTS